MQKTPHKKVWIIGCGDIGQRVASLYQDTQVNATVSSKASVKRCNKLSISAKVIDLDKDYTLSKTDFYHAQVFYFAPPTPTGTEDQRLQNFLRQVGSNLDRIVLISTTGIYGDNDGEWIDENTPVNPQTERALRRLSAEQILQSWANKSSREFMLLRVPGIYAADRLPLARLKQGLPIINEAEAGWTNRIHADDLAQACKAAMNCKMCNQIINITDGNPSTMTHYFNLVADFAKLPRPAQISMCEAEKTLSVGMISYLKESRRIRNDKMLSVLDIKLIYPDFKSALKV